MLNTLDAVGKAGAGFRRWLKRAFDHLPDREIACDYHKQEHKRRADDASAGEHKSVTTCLTAIFHGRLPSR